MMHTYVKRQNTKVIQLKRNLLNSSEPHHLTSLVLTGPTLGEHSHYSAAC